MQETFWSILTIVYFIAGYKAIDYLHWRNRYYFIFDTKNFIIDRIITVLVFGWLAIPAAICMYIYRSSDNPWVKVACVLVPVAIVLGLYLIGEKQLEKDDIDYASIEDIDDGDTYEDSEDEYYEEEYYEEDKFIEDEPEPKKKKKNKKSYVIAYSSDRKLTKNDLKNLSAEKLRLARNEVYARHGRLFNDEMLQGYFNNKKWYKGKIKPENFSESILTDIERYNVSFILEYENSHLSQKDDSESDYDGASDEYEYVNYSEISLEEPEQAFDEYINAFIVAVNENDFSGLNYCMDTGSPFYEDQIDLAIDYNNRGIWEELISYEIVNVDYLDANQNYFAYVTTNEKYNVHYSDGSSQIVEQSFTYQCTYYDGTGWLVSGIS